VRTIDVNTLGTTGSASSDEEKPIEAPERNWLQEQGAGVVHGVIKAGMGAVNTVSL
jgi:hypothetical protein